MLYAVTPYGRRGPSSRVRVYEWLDRIAEPHRVSGYISHHNASASEVVRRPLPVLAAERRLRRVAAERPERLLLHREASPISRGKIERRLVAAAGFTAYDFDDALQWDWGAGGPLRRLAPKARKALIGARNADRVIAGNPVLAEWASQHNSDVVVIPSCVNPARYRRKREYAISDPPRLGWIGSMKNESYLELIASPLLDLHRTTGARLTLVGTTRGNLGELERIIDRVEWSEDSQYELLAEFDIGIGPVPDEPYERGKSGYKLLQYAAAGTPLIASPVGVNRKILRELGMPAPEAEDEWLDAMRAVLAESAAARSARGERARALAERRYSFDAWLPEWRRAVGLPETPR